MAMASLACCTPPVAVARVGTCNKGKVRHRNLGTRAVAAEGEAGGDGAAEVGVRAMRASRRMLLAVTPAGFGAALGLAAGTGEAAAATAVEDIVTPTPVAEVAAFRTASKVNMSGFANLHDPRVYNGLATADRAGQGLAQVSTRYRLQCLMNTMRGTFCPILVCRVSDLSSLSLNPRRGCVQHEPPRPVFSSTERCVSLSRWTLFVST
jgi:hypothetical protein